MSLRRSFEKDDINDYAHPQNVIEFGLFDHGGECREMRAGKVLVMMVLFDECGQILFNGAESIRKTISI